MSVFMSISAPRLFPVFFNIAKPFLSDSTKKKVFMLGCKYLFNILKAICFLESNLKYSLIGNSKIIQLDNSVKNCPCPKLISVSLLTAVRTRYNVHILIYII